MKNIVKLIENLKGSMIGIGLEEQALLDAIEKNDAIYECSLLDSLEIPEEGKKKKRTRRKRYLAIRKMRKKFKKKKHNIMLINYPYISLYLKTVIRDTIYITNQDIYIYGIQEEEELSLLKSRYSRYDVTIDIQKRKKGYLMIIHVGDAKTHPILDRFYFIMDTITNGINLFSDFLVN